MKALGDKEAMEQRGKRGRGYAPNLEDFYTEKATQMVCQYRKKLQLCPSSQIKDKNNLEVLLAKVNLIYHLLLFIYLFDLLSDIYISIFTY